jgi:uncharacterized membrane protein YagU involved in acid resistance
MNWLGLLAAGFVATVLLTTILSAASALGWTRIDIPFILGTAFTASRTRAQWVGWIIHFVMGLGFAIGYGAILTALPGNRIGLGALLGLAHALLVGTVLLNGILPAIHPRMGSTLSAADSSPLLESPGFMLLNYGRTTPVVTIVAHLVYGVILGWLGA